MVNSGECCCGLFQGTVPMCFLNIIQIPYHADNLIGDHISY
jgi:hypothetical protein